MMIPEAHTASSMSSTEKAGKSKVGAEPFVLEKGKRLSESMVWHLGRQYYGSQGLSAWASGTVPFYPTSNPFIVKAYAHVVLAFLRDCAAPRPSNNSCTASCTASSCTASCTIDPTQPVYIVELAAGSGRFSALFVKRLLDLVKASSVESLKIRYVMTDFSETTLRGWMEQPRFRPFVESGVLDFARFDMEQSDRLELLHSGQILAPSALANPLIVLANYALDSATQDLFRIADGNISEGLLCISSRRAEAPDFTDPKLLSKLKLDFEYQAIAGPYYGNPEFDRILENYRESLNEALLLFPVGPLSCIKRLLDIAQGRLLLLSSDLGYTHLSQMCSLTQENVIKIYGGVAATVNFHAIGQYFTNAGGQAVMTSERLGNLKTAAFLLGGSQKQFADTILTFKEQMDLFGPCNFFELMNHLRNSLEAVTLEQLLELLRLSDWDPYVLMKFKAQLPGQVHFASKPAYLELERALVKVEEKFHPLDGDLPFELARLYLAMQKPGEALRCSALSLQIFGDHPATFFNFGLCHYRVSAYAEAIGCFERALQLDPSHARAQLWRANSLAEMPLAADAFLPTSEKE